MNGPIFWHPCLKNKRIFAQKYNSETNIETKLQYLFVNDSKECI